MRKNLNRLQGVLLKISGLIISTVVVGSCSLNFNKNPNVIIIAVEGLGVNQIDCVNESSENLKSGFRTLCQKSIRFTHAFTPSIQSTIALSSLLTGKSPLEIKYPGSQKTYLPSTELTIPEILFANHIPTAFFSGGPPILRRANLHQGFDTFDDFFKPTLQRTFRPFSHLIPQYQVWLKDQAAKGGLSIFYVSDLLYRDFQTFDDFGKARNLSYESQIEELDENLDHFFEFLRKEKIFDSSYIILMGLNRPSHLSRDSELTETNVFSERSQVALLVKPPQKESDQISNITINQNVSLTDIGRSLLPIYGLGSLPKYQIKSELSQDLSGLFQNPQAPLSESRWILTESYWNAHPHSRWALRKNTFLVVLDEKWKVYNTLIDRAETTPISIQDPSLKDFIPEIESFVAQNKLINWIEPEPEIQIKWRALSTAYQENSTPEEKFLTLQKTAHRLLNDSLFQTLYSINLIQRKDWVSLQKWASGLAFKDLEKFANLNLGKSMPEPFQSPCLQALESLNKFGEVSRKCDEKLSYQFLEWVQQEITENPNQALKESAKTKFMRMYYTIDLDEKLAMLNWRYQSAFDFGLNINPESLTLEMMLSFPSAQKFRPIIEKEIQSMHELTKNITPN